MHDGIDAWHDKSQYVTGGAGERCGTQLCTLFDVPVDKGLTHMESELFRRLPLLSIAAYQLAPPAEPLSNLTTPSVCAYL
jgi:hypothetical protein